MPQAVKSPLDVAARWMPDSPESADFELQSLERGDLGDFAEVA